LKAETPSNSLLWILELERRESVHRDGSVDEDTTGGIERREE